MSDDEDNNAQPKTLAERIALLGLGSETARPASRVSQRPTPRASIDTGLGRTATPPAAAAAAAARPVIPNKPQLPIERRTAHGDPVQQQTARNGEPAVQAQHGSGLQRRSPEAPPFSAASVKDRIQSLYSQPQSDAGAEAAPNPFASPELPEMPETCPVSPLPPLPASAVPVFARRATDVARHPMFPRTESMGSPQDTGDVHYMSAENTPRHSIGRGFPPPPPPQMNRPTSVMSMHSTHYPPHVPPKPVGLGASSKSPVTNSGGAFGGRSQSISVHTAAGAVQGPRGASLPPPPAPPQTQRSALPPPPPPPLAPKHTAQSRMSLPPPPPPPSSQTHTGYAYSQPPSGHATTGQTTPSDHALSPASRQPSSGQRVGPALAGTNTSRTALDFSADAALRPVQLSRRGCNRRAPALGVPPFLSVEAAGPVLSCMGGAYSVVAHQARVICTRIATGEIGAIHNAPGPDERFVGLAPVQAARDAADECTRVWACTNAGRVLVLSTNSTGAVQERLGTASHAPIAAMFAAGAGEVWTMRDDGLVEAWRDRSAASAGDGPLAPERRFSIGSELLLARRGAGRPVLLLVQQRELWLAGGRSVWVFDTQRASEPLASVAASALLSTQAAALAPPHTVAQLALTAHDAAIACLASDAGAAGAEHARVYAGTDAGHVVVWRAATRERLRTLDMSGGERDVRVTALACVLDRWLWVGLASGRVVVVDVLEWAVAKEWTAAPSPVTALHVDWTALLAELPTNLPTARAALQVASVHAGGSVYFWDGALTHDRQDRELRRRTAEFAHTRDIGVQINSWNIDAVKPDALDSADRGFVARWLGAGGAAPELLVVGLQEVVDLESKKMTAKSLWRTTTTKAGHARADISKRYGLWRRALEKTLARGGAFPAPFRTVACENLVGLFVCVFARDDVYRHVRDVGVSLVKTGMGGLHGNKGGIGVRLVFDDTSLCFVNAHLAAGESAANNLARIQHSAAIVGGLSFKRPAPAIQPVAVAPPVADLANAALDAFVDGGDGQRFLDHAACFFSGDLNFRLRTSRMLAERSLDAGEVESLLQYDQLLPMIASDAPPAFAINPNPVLNGDIAHTRSASVSSDSSGDDDDVDVEEGDARDVGPAGFALRAFREMPIHFRPTYKYDPGTDRYDSSEKRRTPAWCDRVLFRGQAASQGQPQGQSQGQPQGQPQGQAASQDQAAQHGLITPLCYQRLECRQSDHRPIFATFRVSVKQIDREARARVLRDVHAECAARIGEESAAFARVLWLSRHVASVDMARQLLADSGGDLERAMHKALN
ncbi:hypothetical protein GGF43_001273 [Coemansia sp. RSA 2618]|nr:hypothetical protein GGF43_001273 [Coemansia sp. RSA 2618]